MMANGDSSQQLQPQTHQPANAQSTPNNQHSTAFLQQCLGFGPHPQYTHNRNGNFSADQAAQFLHFLPPTAPNSGSQPTHLFSDFSQHNPYYYPSQNGDIGSRPATTVSPADLKYPNNTELIGEPQTANSTNGSPFERSVDACWKVDGRSEAQLNPNAANMNSNSFYNHFDNCLSAMGDSYPSTSFMGMPPYASVNPYYHYSNPAATHNGSTLSSTTNCMDLMQNQANVAVNAASMLNQWKYSNSEKLGKSSSHGIKSFGKLALSDRISNPPHKIGPGTNNVRVRTQDKYRTVYTDRQRLELEKEFRSHQFVTTERKAVLAGELQLTERQVKIWFQNRRAKSRKQEPTHKSLRFVDALRH